MCRPPGYTGLTGASWLPFDNRKGEHLMKFMTPKKRSTLSDTSCER